MNQLYIVTYNGYFGQGLEVEKSLDIKTIKDIIIKSNIKTKLIDIDVLLEYGVDSNSFYWITSHQNPHVKSYLNDIVTSLFLNYRENLIPSLEMYLAHENKGMQSLLFNKGKDINFIEQVYKIDVSQVGYKSVFKSINGAGSRGVCLVKSTKEIENKLMLETILLGNSKDFIRYIKKTIKKIIPKRYNKSFETYNEIKIPHVIQKFIKGMEFDYKVLVFWDHVYVLKRYIRNNDFRASGSGDFEFVVPNESLIKYCLSVRESLNTPFLSLDVIESQNIYFCVEYQAVHFGPYTQLFAEHVYSIGNDGSLNKKRRCNSIECEFSYSLTKFINRKKNEIL